MSILTRYGGALLAPATAGFDPDARSYIARVEAADGQPLEDGVRRAINQFVVGCKADGIWNAIKASCILAGARTLSGALVPLVGAAPTNFNFVSGDYNRKTGLKGDGATKSLDSNTSPSNYTTLSLSVYLTQASNADACYLGGLNAVFNTSTQLVRLGGVHQTFTRATNSNNPLYRIAGNSNGAGFVGASLVGATQAHRSPGYSTQATLTISNDPGVSLGVFGRRNESGTFGFYSSPRLAFYSIGESLDLALLDARVTTLVNAIGAALP